MHYSPARSIIEWYESQGRDLPWRNTTDPYKIWLSEIILQQTQVSTGTPYYKAFIKKFPNVFALAKASRDDVLKQWEGMGYYSRARNLHETAKTIAEQMDGQFPDHHSELIKLKGIGPYTSRAIGSFAFGNQVGVLDGNVFRVMSRFLGDPSPIDLPDTRKKFQSLLDNWVQKEDAALFNHGIMDLGATICKPRNPNCENCPLQTDCEAFQENNIDAFPVKAKKLKRSTRFFNFYLIKDKKGRILIRRRPDSGLWSGLWEVPNQELKEKDWKKMLSANSELYLGNLKHIFTHFDMQICVYSDLPKEAEKPENVESLQYIGEDEIPIFAFSKAVLKIFKRFLL